MQNINAYPSIDTLSVKSTRNWLENENYKYYIEEKIDGSQLSIVIDNDGKLSFYNKNKRAGMNNSFEKAITMLNFKYDNKNILNPDYTYYGESVCRIKHNVCVYERTPKFYFILYDIFNNVSNEYVSSEIKKLEADRVGFEIVQTLYQNTDPNQNPYDICEKLINQIESGEIKSCLGGTIEGVVLKHHAFIKKGNPVATKLKLVTTKFKERHSIKQPKTELSADDFLISLGNSFCTEARFHKAYQHLIENNTINPENIKNKDRDKIIMELNSDFDKEYKDELKELLYTEFSPLLKKLAREGSGNWFTKTYLPENNDPDKLFDKTS
jgi:hypothetical protein